MTDASKPAKAAKAPLKWYAVVSSDGHTNLLVADSKIDMLRQLEGNKYDEVTLVEGREYSAKPVYTYRISVKG